MPTEILSNYLNAKRVQNDLTYEALSTMSNIPEQTIKNLFTGKTKNPGIETLKPLMDALGGSFDEVFYPGKSKTELQETSVLALKDIYEQQLSDMRKSNEEHIHNIRAHYEQHHEDLKDNYEKRLSDKRELIESQKEHIKTLEKDCLSHKIAFWICIVVFVGVLIAEVMNPNMGWFRF